MVRLKSDIFSWKSLLWPLLVAGAYASWFVVTAPGPLAKDAAQYDALARSILHGQYQLDGVTTMFREPGYSVFRAALYAVGFPTSAILWVQVALIVATIWLATSAVRRIDERLVLPTAWLSAIYAGLTYTASQSYSECFTAFILALVGYVAVRVIAQTSRPTVEIPNSKFRPTIKQSNNQTAFTASCFPIALAIILGLLCGYLALTRGVYLFFGLLCAVVLFCFMRRETMRKRLLIAVSIFGASLLLIVPWIVRNEILFGRPALALRAGTNLYARAVKAKQSWSVYAVSLGSATLGQAAMTKWAPTVTPFVMMEQYRETWAVYLPMTEVMPDWKADAIMFARAKGTILSSPAVFTRYVAWSAIDCWRLLAFASPLSPGFPIEAMFNVQAAAGPLSMAQVLILVVAHVIEWIWVIGTLIGLVLGFRAYGLKFVPGWIVGY
ncbi:MAG: hypothetical protein WC895_04660, partial [Candidatus Shapirobacteria bacterium]